MSRPSCSSIPTGRVQAMGFEPRIPSAEMNTKDYNAANTKKPYKDTQYNAILTKPTLIVLFSSLVLRIARLPGE